MSNITIIGAGVMGSTVTFPACDNGHKVRLVGTPFDSEIIDCLKKDGYHPALKRSLPEGIEYAQIDALDKALENCNLVIAGISSFGVDWFASEVLSHIPTGLPVLIVTKGLHSRGNGEVCSFVDYFEEKCDKRMPFFAIGGPCISYELADRHNTFIGICGYEQKHLAEIRGMLETPYYHINTTTDVMGFELASAIKNIYALAVSMAIGAAEKLDGEGCRPHYNAQSGLFAQSIREMNLLIKTFGGSTDNLVYGVSDLYITVESGRNREIGLLLGRGYSADEAIERLKGMTLESVSAVKSLAQALYKKEERGEFSFESVPLFSHVNDIMSGKCTANIPWQKF